MLPRGLYLKQLTPFIDKPQIKILTGIRRSGKSSVLFLLKEELLARGVFIDKIIHINLESFEYLDLHTAKELYQFVKKNTLKKTQYISITVSTKIESNLVNWSFEKRTFYQKWT